jgi:hypothetical protein
MRIQQPELAILHQCVGIFQIGVAGADRFDFGAGKHDPGFQFVLEKIIMACRAIHGRIAFAGSDGIAPDILWFSRLSCMYGLAGHESTFRWSVKFLTQRKTSFVCRSGLGRARLAVYNRAF